MKKQIVFLLIACAQGAAWQAGPACALADAATQPPAQTPSQGATPKGARNEAGAAAREKEKAAEREAAARRRQAVGLLKGVVEGSGEMSGTLQREAVVSAALDALWKPDETFARAGFLKSAERLFARFASDDAKPEERLSAKQALVILLKALARHDPRAAEELSGRFIALAREASKGAEGAGLSLRDRLSLASASLDLDPAQSAAAAARVLEAGVPTSLPEYLNELERRDAAAAASLCRTALAALAAGKYGGPSAVILSSYVFRERQPFYPTAMQNESGQLRFGMMIFNSSPPPTDKVDPDLVRAYLAAAGALLSAEAATLEQSDEPSGEQAGFDYFLVRKLKGYADKLGANGDHSWDALDARFAIIARRAKLSAESLGSLARAAQRIVAENRLIDESDGGAYDFANAEKTQDPDRKTMFLTSGINQLIEARRFAEAEQKIADVKDSNARARLSDYLHFAEAEASIKKADWDVVNDQINRVVEERLRAYLLLEAARGALGAKVKGAAAQYLRAAAAVIPKIEDEGARVRASVAAAGTAYALEPAWGAQALADAVKAINGAQPYDGGEFGVMIDAPHLSLWFPLQRSDLRDCFAEAGRADWPTAVAAAEAINSKELQSWAYVAACRAVLEKMK